MVGLITEQIHAPNQFMSPHCGGKLNPPTLLFPKRPGLVKGKMIDINQFWRTAQGYSVPTQQPGDIEIVWVGHHPHQDQIGTDW
jgi:hypothetical protein